MDEHKKNKGDRRDKRLNTATERHSEDQNGPRDGHIVFDFSGLRRPKVTDLALIVTARLKAPPEESVWIHDVDWRTARILRGLGLDHLFRHYPKGPVEN